MANKDIVFDMCHLACSLCLIALRAKKTLTNNDVFHNFSGLLFLHTGGFKLKYIYTCLKKVLMVSKNATKIPNDYNQALTYRQQFM